MPFWRRPTTMFGLWLLVGVISAVVKHAARNNFLIFKYVFWHVWNGTGLYIPYPEEYKDVNHYGPLFSLVIAPYAVQPIEWIGMLMWHVSLAMFLYFAIRQLYPQRQPAGVSDNRGAVMIYWFCAHELLTALFMSQFNVATCAMIILTYVAVQKERDGLAAFWIVVGTMVKLYGIVGLAFFFFSRHKVRFVVWTVVWTAVLFCLPMLISSPQYICEQYREWMICLAGKSDDNLLTIMQNVSLLGIVRKTMYVLSGGYVVDGVLVGGTPLNYSDLWLIIPGMALMATGYFRVGQWGNEMFRRTVLAGVLMFVCLFSDGTESSGYIIALTGCCVWYVSAPWQRSRWDVALMVFAFILTSLSPSDLFPAYIRREYVHPLALKALPVALIWLKLCYELIRKDYKKE